MNWTPQQFKEWSARRLKDSERAREKMYANRNSPQLSATVTQPDHGLPLDRLTPAQEASGIGPYPRLKITFVVRSVRPCDWDNICTKFLQDSLIDAGILPGDGWNVLQGQVISLKANSREEEGTTVVIETL